MFHLFHFTETKRASNADISSIVISMPIVAINEILEPKSPSTVRVHTDMMAVADYQESLDYLLEHVKKVDWMDWRMQFWYRGRSVYFSAIRFDI